MKYDFNNKLYDEDYNNEMLNLLVDILEQNDNDESYTIYYDSVGTVEQIEMVLETDEITISFDEENDNVIIDSTYDNYESLSQLIDELLER